jgi:hypothetical protein
VSVNILNRRIIMTPALASGTPGANNTWDPTRKSAGSTLSNGNLTATCNTSSGGFVAGFAVNSTVSSKIYWEITAVSFNSSSFCLCGFDNGSAATNSFLGSGNDSMGVHQGGGGFFNGSGTGTVFPSVSAGDVVGFAVDFNAKIIWTKNITGGTTWCVGSAIGDPALGTGGFSFATINVGTGAFFAGYTLDFNALGTVYTANFGATAYAQTPPTGYGNW